jgi:hypothetical protein
MNYFHRNQENIFHNNFSCWKTIFPQSYFWFFLFRKNELFSEIK